MADHHRRADKALVQRVLLEDPEFLRRIVERALQQVLEAEITEHIAPPLPAHRMPQRAPVYSYRYGWISGRTQRNHSHPLINDIVAGDVGDDSSHRAGTIRSHKCRHIRHLSHPRQPHHQPSCPLRR